MDNKIYQYGGALPPEMCDDVIVEVTCMMGIEFDKKKYYDAMHSSNGVAVFRDPNNKDRFALIAAIDTYHTVIVRCTEEEHEKVKNYLLKQINMSDEYTQENPFKDLKNEYNTERNGYKRLLEWLNVDYI